MKYYILEEKDGAWKAELRTDGMADSVAEKVVSMRTSNEVNPIEPVSGMIQAGFPSHLGEEVTEVGLIAQATAEEVRLQKQYEGGAAESLVVGLGVNILSFVLPEQTGDAVIDSGAFTVAIEVANGTTVTALVPLISVSPGATVDPASGAAEDFTSPVVYTVTAEDGVTTQDWTVTVTVAA